MLVIVMFRGSRSILVNLSLVATPTPDGAPNVPTVNDVRARALEALRLAGYTDPPFACVALDPGGDHVIGEVELVDLASMIADVDDPDADAASSVLEKFLDELDGSEVWLPVVGEPLARLIEQAEQDVMPDEPAPVGLPKETP